MPDCSHKSDCTEQQEVETCSKITYQSATVSVPVTVKPKVNTGAINTFCCGDPIVKPSLCTLKYKTLNGVCSYTISQNICVEVPIVFSANAFVETPCIECGEVSSIDICKDCGK